MEKDSKLEKFAAFVRKATTDLLNWLNSTRIERDNIIKEAIKENEAKKINLLKDKIERM